MSKTSLVCRSILQAILPAILLVSLAGMRGAAQSTDGRVPQPGPPRGQYTIKPFHIIGNIYSVGLSNNTSFLITTPQGNILLDPTLEAAVPDIRRNIEQLGFPLKDIKIILQSHAHADHVGGLADFQALTGAKVAVMAQDAEAVAVGREEPATAEIPVMAEDAGVIADGGASDFRGGKWKPVHPDRILHDGDKVELGGVTMVAHLTAGHTKGCTTWSTVAEENGKKYNVVFVCSLRINTGIPMVKNPKYPNMAEAFAKAFKTLKSLPCDVFLVSHGNQFDLDEKIKRLQQGTGSNPFIDPQGYRTYITTYETAFQDQLKKEQAGGPPYAVSPPPAQLCPQDGRTCYGGG